MWFTMSPDLAPDAAHGLLAAPDRMVPVRAAEAVSEAIEAIALRCRRSAATWRAAR